MTSWFDDLEEITLTPEQEAAATKLEKTFKKQSRESESKHIEPYFVKVVRSYGAKAYKWRAEDNRGVPDRLVLTQGALLPVELKTTTGTRSPAQIKLHSHFAAYGVLVPTLYGKEEIDAWAKTTLSPHKELNTLSRDLTKYRR